MAQDRYTRAMRIGQSTEYFMGEHFWDGEGFSFVGCNYDFWGAGGGDVAGSFSEDQDSRNALSWELMGLWGYKE